MTTDAQRSGRTKRTRNHPPHTERRPYQPNGGKQSQRSRSDPPRQRPPHNGRRQLVVSTLFPTIFFLNRDFCAGEQASSTSRPYLVDDCQVSPEDLHAHPRVVFVLVHLVELRDEVDEQLRHLLLGQFRITRGICVDHARGVDRCQAGTCNSNVFSQRLIQAADCQVLGEDGG